MTGRTLDVLDRPEVLAALFHPRRDGGLPRLGSGIHTVRIPVDGDVHVGGRIFVARAGAPVILYFHGNGEIASDYDAIAPLYLRPGLTLFVVDYRGYGTSDGHPTATALINDAWAVYEQAPAVLAGRGIEAGDLTLMGRSLGSAAVLEIAARLTAGSPHDRRPRGLILESGFAHTFPLIERIGLGRPGDADEARDGFGNLEKMARIDMPTLVIHGESDWIIPVSDGIALFDACPSEDKRLVTVPGAGHNDLMLVGQRAYFSAIAEFCGVGHGARPD
ncbi:MAG: alpha/beta hydrolase [Rhodospirillales bacterium]|nr:alpha/beta hydrolase [Rhodospirillales bacterium]